MIRNSRLAVLVLATTLLSCASLFAAGREIDPGTLGGTPYQIRNVSVASNGSAFTLSASESRLGPEIAVSPLSSLGPSAGSQTNPSIASNGLDSLAVWNQGYGGAVYATRLRADGGPAEPLGHRVIYGDGRRPFLASAGSDYVLVAGSHSQHVDLNGVAISPPHLLPSQETVASISNGNTYIVIQRRFNSVSAPELLATILNFDGAPVKTVQLPRRSPVAVGLHNGKYLVVSLNYVCGNTSCVNWPLFDEINDDAGVTRQVAAPSIPFLQNISAAVSPEGVIITGQVGSTASYAFFLFKHDGSLNSPLLNGQSGPTISSSSGTSVFWDGHQYLLIVSLYQKPPIAFRVSASGALIDDRPLALPWQSASMAATVTGFRAAWSDSRFDPLGDIVTRQFRDFDELATTPDSAVLLSYSGEGQFDVRVLPLPASQGLFSVWTDAAAQRISGFLGGKVVTVAQGSSVNAYHHVVAAVGKRTISVSWLDMSTYPGKIQLQQLRFDGALLGPRLTVSSTNPYTYSIPDLLFDGNQYILAWTDKGALQTAEITEDGWVGQTAAILPPANDYLSYDEPHLLANPEGALVTYSIGRGSMIPEFQRPQAAGLARLQSSSRTLSDVAFDDVGQDLSTAASADRVVFVWRRFSGGEWLIELAQSSIEGRQLSRPVVIAHLPVSSRFLWPPETTITWNESEFVLVWNEPFDIEKRRVRALRLNRYGEVIDAEPFELAAGLITPGPPSVTATPSGVVISYTRSDTENGSAPRAFLRTLDRVPALPRGRSVRH